MQVKKAIIPAAGLGTRFLPATKAQPKEMLPIVDKPTIQYIIEEAVASGIEDIIIVTGRGKRAIEDHFDKSYELEEALANKGKWNALEEVQSIANLANIHYIRQKEPLGLGHAVAQARTFIGNEPFAVLLGDDIVRADTPSLKQLINIYEETELPVIGVQTVQPEDVSKYGIVATKNEPLAPRATAISHLVEKPAQHEAPSNLAIMGRYVLTPDIFPILANLTPGSGGEIQLTDAINELNVLRQVIAYEFEGTRYDVGDKFGFIKATIDFALTRQDLRNDLLIYMQNMLAKSEKE
ncbi:UTP--glucose-1-phosphate uridylyltransferase GalU [Mangrovibacillus cuniculi]|uniref:UTP--glucose-1-phosphate uridylyltransferase n=1 Tax=Mangrovibacillus cuniculi TaxID=2593652 RepID=A0A7S8CD97_9BACI|nr:UTP--glucose-1-phosphate uridylyltransferase GalU [Mangrovibacillus cuniculi]QPC47668.1 UTP--glucose-1-phosphate uridylyltransferase GalU [Mangrovibacillus cuniculi]